ncbi:hypothetical protein [Bacillus sp. S/N-304-OC-R1]|uniref:hypothetical protein n=1 Tax=Bacillus sp. S/N-304-OC-R1 TaxID=2758034 RepID=UPI0021AF7F2F|nr:hypothetical protein [Bacillus sp. S/N-304-OC-R1]
MSHLITREMLSNYNELNLRKKEIEAQLDELKKAFNQYFDMVFGENMKGELIISDYKLQRQIRVTEKYKQDTTVHRLEELNMTDLIQKKPDEEKIKSALNLGLLKEEDLEGCKLINKGQAIYVKRTETK